MIPTHAAAVLAAALAAALPARAADCCHRAEGDGAQAPPAPSPRFERTARRYRVPDAVLLDQRGRSVRLAEALAPGAPLALNFVFTTCTTICPVMSATFAALRARLADGAPLRLVSITIDPEQDRPVRLEAYARRFGADPSWRFLTGEAEEVRAVLAAFDALPREKTGHRPITLLRRAGAEEWIRIDGLATAEALASELSPRSASAR